MSTHTLKKRNILFIEPFYGGSHADFADNIKKHSRHSYDLMTLPDTNWKERMRFSAYHFAKMISLRSISKKDYDCLITCDMLSLSQLCTLWPSHPPVLLYFHENQLDYPLSEGQGGKQDLYFNNIDSAFAADTVIFNSRYHREVFLEKAEILLKNKTGMDASGFIQVLRDKAFVLYPGVSIPAISDSGTAAGNKHPVILWNHRWEYDKNPEAFFSALRNLAQKNIEFGLVICGERTTRRPVVFHKAKTEFARSIQHFGYIENKTDYFKVIQNCDIVVSTARQENFGISIVEAILCGSFPVLPDRLSYPELVPGDLHKDVLYSHDPELAPKLEHIIRNKLYISHTKQLSQSYSRFSWHNLIHEYDAFIDKRLEK